MISTSLLTIVFSFVLAIHGSYYFTSLYCKSYKKFLRKKLRKLNYKIEFGIDNIPNLDEEAITMIPLVNAIYVLIKYSPLNTKRIIKELKKKDMLIPIHKKKISKDKQELKEVTKKEQIDNSNLLREKVKEQVKLTKELNNSDVALVLKIQTLLVKLKTLNPKSYDLLSKEYEQLAREDKLNSFMLKDFLARILVSLEYDIRDGSALINYLDFLITITEKRILMNSQQDEKFSFQELEQLTKEIINNSNIYSNEDKIVIYKKISLLYLYLIYESKYINIDEVRDSCFNYEALLYATILNIVELNERNVIESNLAFDINENYSLESIVKLIKEIKFIKKETEEVTLKEQIKIDSSDTTLVLKIQTLLVKLKTLNSKSYETLNKEYEVLAKEGKLNNLMLKDFLARILSVIEYEENNISSIIDYLDVWIDTYEQKFRMDMQVTKSLTFKELEHLTKEIINNKTYSNEDKVVIYKKISLLYLYLIYENKYINIAVLRDSCFNYDALLYAAILNIVELKKRNVIEDNLAFDINEKYDLESVVRLITEIKFIRNKQFVKNNS